MHISESLQPKMKITFIILLILITTNISYSQKLSLKDLQYIYKQGSESANNYLVKKGFNFYRRKSNELTDITSYIGKNQTFVIIYADLIKYQFHNSLIYTSIREECIKNGYRLVNEVTFTPEGSGLTFIFSKGKTSIYLSQINLIDKTKYIITYCEPFPLTEQQFYMNW